MLPYDLIGLENPYPGRIDPKFAKLGPVLRGDWLADALAPGTPLSADLRSLAEMQDPGETPCGPKVRAFEQPKFKLLPPANPPITAPVTKPAGSCGEGFFGGAGPSARTAALALKSPKVHMIIEY